MNLVTKTIPLIAATLLAMSPIYGQEDEEDFLDAQESQISMKQTAESSSERRGHPLCLPLEPTCQPFVCKPEKCGNVQEPQSPTIPAYNSAAEINTGIMEDWNTFGTLSFLYWQPLQDDMRVARQGSAPIGALLSTTGSTDHGKLIDMDFDYKPAFKVAVGMNFRNDNWVGMIEYTRLRSTDSASASVPVSNPTLYNLWGEEFTTTKLAFNSLSAKFKCKLDFIDMEMDRSYFVGRKLSFRTGMGMRVALIAESMVANYSFDGGAAIPNATAQVLALPGTMNAVNRTISWGIGPKMGVEMNWMLGVGFRLLGSAFADVLYTSYKIQTKTRITPTVTSAPFYVGYPITATGRDDNYGMLRAHLDFELGSGWGTYFDYNNMHFDIMAAYGFQVFFNQNMLRLPVNGPSNLYVQGLTVTARMDF